MRRALRQRTDRKWTPLAEPARTWLPAVEPEVLEELRRLRARVPDVTGALAATSDGVVLAHDTATVEPEGVAALTAAALGVAQSLAGATRRGAFRELLVRGENGYVAAYAAGSTAVLTVLAGDRTNIGRLHMEARRSGARLADLVGDALSRAERP